MKVFLMITAVIRVILLNLIVIAALKVSGRNRDWEAEDQIQAEELRKRREKYLENRNHSGRWSLWGKTGSGKT